MDNLHNRLEGNAALIDQIKNATQSFPENLSPREQQMKEYITANFASFTPQEIKNVFSAAQDLLKDPQYLQLENIDRIATKAYTDYHKLLENKYKDAPDLGAAGLSQENVMQIGNRLVTVLPDERKVLNNLYEAQSSTGKMADNYIVNKEEKNASLFPENSGLHSYAVETIINALGKTEFIADQAASQKTLPAKSHGNSR